MRPINKGMPPYTGITRYQQAEPYLEERLGRYCSFCEMRVNNHLAVEHKESKKSGGALTDWDNLLLACSYCNSRKLEKIKRGDMAKWIWPDQDNTFLAFTYGLARRLVQLKIWKFIKNYWIPLELRHTKGQKLFLMDWYWIIVQKAA